MNNDAPLDAAQLEMQEISLFLEVANDVIKLFLQEFPDGLPIKVKARKIIVGDQVRDEHENLLEVGFYQDIDGWVERYSALKSLSNYLGFMFENELIDLPNFSDENGNRVIFDLEKTVTDYAGQSEDLVVFPIVDVVRRSLNLSCSEDELVKSYKKYIEYKKSSSVCVIKNTPLIGFESEVSSFRFSDEFSVEVFSDRHKNEYNTSGFDFINRYTLREIRFATHMIRWERVVSKGVRLQDDHEQNLFLLIMSLRLSVSSDVVAKFSFSEPKDIISIVGLGGSWHFETSKPWQFYDSHKFEISDLLEVKAMFENMLGLKGISGYKNIFNVVVKRYLSSLSRTSPEDSVIDFTICLESLLLASERDELKFRLSLRGANLLENEDPLAVKKILANMYDDRSSIVHEGKTLNDLRKSNSIIAIKEYRSVTEKIIRAYIEKSCDFNGVQQINEHLDRLCLFAAKKSQS